MDIKLIIFDFDGTLGNTRQTVVKTMRQTLEELRLPERSEEDCAATIGLPLAGCFRRLLPDIPEKVIDRCTEVYHKLFLINKENMQPLPFPHVQETLKQLRRQGIRMSIATSRGLASVKDLLTDMDIIMYFDYLLGADNVTKHKPDPEPVLLTLREMKVGNTQTLVVGDMPADIQMGNRANCLTCGVTYGNATRKELADASADFIIDDFADIPDIIKKEQFRTETLT